MIIKAFFLVAIGGAAGSVLRYVTGLAAMRYTFNGLPAGTFLVNILGSFLMGLIMGGLAKEPNADLSLKLLLMTGFCGGFTTFSAFALENLRLIQQQLYFQAFGYIFLSTAVSILTVFAGMYLSARMVT
jgi:fluoride exporter